MSGSKGEDGGVGCGYPGVSRGDSLGSEALTGVLCRTESRRCLVVCRAEFNWRDSAESVAVAWVAWAAACGDGRTLTLASLTLFVRLRVP